MTAIAKKLDASLSRWTPETAKEVERLVAEIIELADRDALVLKRSRDEGLNAQQTSNGQPSISHQRTRELVASSNSSWSDSSSADREDRR